MDDDATETTVVLEPAVAAFLLEVVNSIQLSATAPNFLEQAALIVAAQQQLSQGRQ